MPVATIDFEVIVERVRSQVAGYRVVDYAATLEALKQRGLPALPAAFVLPDAEAPSTNKSAGGVHQDVRNQFFVYSFVKYANDALGGKAKDLMKPLRDPLLEGLLAWKPPGADGVIAFAGGRTEQIEGGIFVWRDAFAFRHIYRRIP